MMSENQKKLREIYPQKIWIEIKKKKKKKKEKTSLENYFEFNLNKRNEHNLNDSINNIPENIWMKE